jgi:hypothetical protein
MNWYLIPYAPFEANEAGQIRNPRTDRILQPTYKYKVSDTRKRFHASWTVDGVKSQITTSWARLILSAKLGRPLLSWEDACHVNGDNGDDRMENLEAKSRLRNIIDEYKIGRLPELPNEEIDKAIAELQALKK